MISRAVKLGCLVYTIPDGLLYRQEKYSGLIRKKKTAIHIAIKSGTVTYPICDGSLSRSARRTPASLQKCVKKAVSGMVLVQVQRLSGIAST